MGLVRPSGYEVWGLGELHRTMEVDQAVIDKIVLPSGSFIPVVAWLTSPEHSVPHSASCRYNFIQFFCYLKIKLYLCKQE